MSIRDWLTTAASNIGLFPEKMPRNQVNDSARQLQAAVKGFADELPYYEFTDTVTYASANVFSVTGDYTATLPDGSRVRAQGISTGTINGRVTGTSFAGSSTAVTVEWDDGGALSNETLRVWKNVAGLDYFASPAEITAGTDANKPLNIANLVSSINQNTEKSGDGYWKVPGGLILQWGEALVSDDTQTNISWPITFPNACLQAVVCYSNAQQFGSNSVDPSIGIHSLTASGATVRNTGNADTVRFLAIGF